MDLRLDVAACCSCWFRYYTTRLYIGTPSQEFALIVDSGSTVTYVPCATCEQCGNHQVGLDSSNSLLTCLNCV